MKFILLMFLFACGPYEKTHGKCKDHDVRMECYYGYHYGKYQYGCSPRTYCEEYYPLPTEKNVEDK